MAKDTFKKIWQNEYVKMAIMLILIVAIVLGFWRGFQFALNTEYPAQAVASGSMCQVEYMNCDGLFHPFEPTLHTGDLIIVQGSNPQEIKTGRYPHGDIIVFHKPRSRAGLPDELIVHRAMQSITRENGLVYFETKGDGSSSDIGDPWPPDYRGENYSWNGMISEKLLVGKVVMRIPWFGHVSLFMRDSSGIFIIVILMVILVVVEFVIPVLTGEKAEASARAEAMQEEEEETFESVR